MLGGTGEGILPFCCPFVDDPEASLPTLEREGGAERFEKEDGEASVVKGALGGIRSSKDLPVPLCAF